MLDSLDVFIYHADRVVRSIAEIHATDHVDWQSPMVSRMVCILGLAKDSLLSIGEMSLMLRSGVIRPASLSTRKLHEIQVTADFIRLDSTGEVSIRWQHWEIYDRARLDPANPGAQTDKETLLRQTTYGESELKKRGHWAQLPDGRKYYSLHSRAEYVRCRSEEEWPLNSLSLEERADIYGRTSLELDRANALIHPTIIGNEHIQPPALLVSGATLSTIRTVKTYYAVAIEEYAFVSLQEDIRVSEMWREMSTAYLEVASEITGSTT